MAITTTSLHLYPPFMEAEAGASNVSLAGLLLNASGDKSAFVVTCPKAGTLDKFEWRTEGVANNPDNGVRCSFQTPDATTGMPDGTQDEYRDITGTISASTWQVPGLMTSDGTDGGVKRTVTAGESIACVIEFVSFVASDSFSPSYVGTNTSNPINTAWWHANGSTGIYVKSTSSFPNFALKYDDGTYASFPAPIGPYTAITYSNLSSSTTPDEVGCRFQVPIACRVAGVWARLDMNDDMDFVLYDNAGTAQRTISVNSDTIKETPGLWMGYFDTTYDLSAATTYRIVAKPTTTTNSNFQVFTLPGNTYLQTQPGGVEWYHTSRTDAGSWTDDDTRVASIGLLITGYDVVAGGGGGGGAFTFAG